MNASIRMLSLSLSSLALVAAAWAQYPPAYPAKGQSQQQQADDSTACRSWAQQTTGIDPAVASQPAPQQTGPAAGGGQRARGAVRGAAAGAVIGEVGNGDAGQGAKTGAAVGVVAGGSRARQGKTRRECERAAEPAERDGHVQQRVVDLHERQGLHGRLMFDVARACRDRIDDVR